MGQGFIFYLNYSFKALRNNGQRVVLAILCVTFGVMSLVAMQNMAEAITSVVQRDPSYRLGGQAELSYQNDYLDQAKLAEVEQLKQAGKIARYSPTSEEFGLKLKVPGATKVAYINRGLGFDPAVYPLLGKLQVTLPASVSQAQAIKEPGAAFVARDIADNFDLKLGDRFMVSNNTDLAPYILKVAGIVTDTPDSSGDKIYYSLDTARLMYNRAAVVNYVQVMWPEQGDIAVTKAELQNNGWSILNATDQGPDARQAADLFNFMLKGAGILGLLVGGIGVANTMVVLLANRQKEIAILKTLGYRRSHLFILLGLEVGLMGLAGSLLGVALAYLVSGGLIYLFSQTSSLLAVPSFNPLLGLLGIFIGTVTTLIFGMFAIVRASEVRPMQLLRNLPVKIRWFQTALLAVGLAIPFSVVTSLVLGSVLEGIGILLIALGGLVVLGSVLGLVMWLVVKALPTFRFHFLAMARKNLARRWLVNLFAMIALFAGIFTAGFAGVVIQGAQNQLSQRSSTLTGYNLAVDGTASQEPAMRSALEKEAVKPFEARYLYQPKQVEAASPPAGDEENSYTGVALNGRETPWDMKLTGAAWNADPLGVYLPDYMKLQPGTNLIITNQDGAKTTVKAVGSYEAKDLKSPVIGTTYGILLPRDLLLKIGGDKTRLSFAGQVGLDRLDAASLAIGKALPDTMVVTSKDYNNYTTQRIRNFFIFAVSMAGLAILAGLLLVANTVGLAMIHRQREMGVLKSVGYTRWHVLKSLLYEYGLLAVVASVSALVGVQVAVIALSKLEDATDGILRLDLPTALASIGLALIVTLVTATLASWQALKVRPLELLRQET